jgi:hypothetical protein
VVNYNNQKDEVQVLIRMWRKGTPFALLIEW